jgi:hypothetical protein
MLRAAWQDAQQQPGATGLWAVGWAWRRMMLGDVDEAVARERAWSYGPGLAILGGYDGEPYVTWLGGEAAAWPMLLRALDRHVGRQAGPLHLLLPAEPVQLAAAERASFRGESHYRVFEKTLPGLA